MGLTYHFKSNHDIFSRLQHFAFIKFAIFELFKWSISIQPADH